MQKIARLTPFLSVAPQPAEADLAILATMGFGAVISNRPDGEADDQPSAAAMAEAARRNGMEFRHLPVVPGQVGEEDVAAFAAALRELLEELHPELVDEDRGVALQGECPFFPRSYGVIRHCEPVDRPLGTTEDGLPESEHDEEEQSKNRAC
mgnify:CR=1 FL=1